MPLVIIAAGLAGGAVLFGKGAGEGLGDAFKVAVIVGAITYVVTR